MIHTRGLTNFWAASKFLSCVDDGWRVSVYHRFLSFLLSVILFQACSPLLVSDFLQGLLKRILFGVLFWHGVRGGSSLHDLRRGELVVIQQNDNPAKPQRGVKFEEMMVKKTRTVSEMHKANGSSTSSNYDVAIVWNEAWADLVLFYKSKLPPALPQILKTCIADGVDQSGFSESQIQAFAPMFMKPTQNRQEAQDINAKYWYQGGSRRGKNLLTTVFRDISHRLNFSGYLSNTCGRCTLACTLAASGLPDSVSMQFTGHKSVSAFRAYAQRNVSEASFAAASVIINDSIKVLAAPEASKLMDAPEVTDPGTGSSSGVTPAPLPPGSAVAGLSSGGGSAADNPADPAEDTAAEDAEVEKMWGAFLRESPTDIIQLPITPLEEIDICLGLEAPQESSIVSLPPRPSKPPLATRSRAADTLTRPAAGMDMLAEYSAQQVMPPWQAPPAYLPYGYVPYAAAAPPHGAVFAPPAPVPPPQQYPASAPQQAQKGNEFDAMISSVRRTGVKGAFFFPITE